MKNPKYSLLLSLVIALNTSPAWGLGQRDISLDVAEKGIPLSVSRGYGVVINLATMGQTVSNAWLSDPSQLTLASNKGACTGDQCAGASVLYLKPIDKLNFPGLPTAIDGASLLSIITNQGKVLQFKLSVTSQVPSYTSISLTPAQAKPLPIAQPPITQVIRPQPEPQPLAIGPVVREPKIVVSLPSEKNDIEILHRLSQESRPEAPKEVKKETVKPDVLEPEPEPEVEPEEVKPQAAVIAEQKSDDLSPRTQEDIHRGGKENVSQPVHPQPDHTAVLPTETRADRESPDNQALAAALLRGLHSVRGKKEVGYRSLPYRQAQDLIYLLKREVDLSLEQAIAKSRIKPSVAQALIEYGSRY